MKESANKLDKSEPWMVKWSSRNESCEDEKQTRIPNIPLNEVAKRDPGRAKYKRRNSARELSQWLAT